jgi:hypothetical protein
MNSKRIRIVVMGLSVAGLISAGSLPLMAQNTGSKSCGPDKGRSVTPKQSEITVPMKIDNPAITKGKGKGQPASAAKGGDDKGGVVGQK